MVTCADLQRPPSRSNAEPPTQLPTLPPRPAFAAAVRNPPRSSRGPPGAMRSLSPALQVMQRSMLCAGPDAPKVPDAPRGERPREYLAALHMGGSPRSAASPEVPASGFAQSRSCSPLCSSSSLPLAAVSGVPQLNARSSQDNLFPLGSARSRRPASSDPVRPGSARQDSFHRAPTSARIRRATPEPVPSTLFAPQSARLGNRQCSGAVQLRTDEKIEVCNMWPTDRGQRWSSLDAADAATEDLKKPSRIMTPAKPSTTFAPRQAQEPKDDAMDALDGLLASLDEEKNRQTKAPLTSVQMKPSAPSSSPDVKATSSSRHKCGIAPVPAKPAVKGRAVAFDSYDDGVFVDSTSSLEIDDSSASAGVYCSLSPTIMSVHLPGSPIPKAMDFDDTQSSLVFLADPPRMAQHKGRPCKVRFECKGQTVSKHAPQPPSRRKCDTGKIVSRPLGCTSVAMGGA